MTFTLRSAMEWLELSASDRRLLLANYGEEHRAYHNDSHLDAVLRWLPDDPLARVPLKAILYHDIYYAEHYVSPGYNEAMSIAAYCASDGRNADLPEVVHIINATAYHHLDQMCLTDSCKLVLDLDLQSFAQPRDEFLRDSHNVKLEYLPLVGEDAFLEGNKKFLQMLLKRKSLYYVKTEWEGAARANLEWRIENMRAEP